MAVTITTALEAEFSAGVWTDITADVIKDVAMDRGIQGSGPKDRVAGTGTLKFELNNSASNSGSKQGYYSPGHTDARTGFEEGLAVRLKLTYSGMTRYKFHGKVSDIQPMPGKYKNQLTMVTAVDYMDEIARHKLDGLTVQTDVTADEVLTAVIGNIPTSPLNTRYDTGTDTFAYALGSERDEGTTALSAAQKDAQSELSWIYVTGNPTDGETLVYANRHNRILDWTTPTDISAVEAAGLKWLYDETNGMEWTDNTNWGETATANDWYGITVGGGNVEQILLGNNNLFGSAATFPIEEFTSLTYISMDRCTSLSGDISGWTLPATLIGIWLHTTGLSGDISGWTLPATLTTINLATTSLENSPIVSSAVALNDFDYYDCGLSEAHVDAVCLAIYNQRASFTDATPEMGIGGTNAAPSGTYQDGDPPTTGKEYIYELENDPETEGFNVWAITYTA